MSNCTMKVCWPIFGLCSFQDPVINFQLIMDQNDFMNYEVSSNIRCDQICRVSHFCTRHFHLTPTSCCCSLVVSVPTAALGEGKDATVRCHSPTLVLSMISCAIQQCSWWLAAGPGMLHCNQGSAELLLPLLLYAMPCAGAWKKEVFCMVWPDGISVHPTAFLGRLVLAPLMWLSEQAQNHRITE